MLEPFTTPRNWQTVSESSREVWWIWFWVPCLFNIFNQTSEMTIVKTCQNYAFVQLPLCTGCLDSNVFLLATFVWDFPFVKARYSIISSIWFNVQHLLHIESADGSEKSLKATLGHSLSFEKSRTSCDCIDHCTSDPHGDTLSLWLLPAAYG